MSEPTSPELGPPERLHPAFLLAGLGGSLRQLSGGYAVLAYLIVMGRLGTALSVAIGLIAITLIGTFLYWRRFEFRVGSNEIRIDSGIFSRTHRSIPFDRIQDVDISQGVLARLIEVASVRFETGGASAGGADEGVLRAVPLERAEELRTLIRSRRLSASPVPKAAAETEAEARPVYAMDTKRLALAGFFNFSLAIFAGLFGLTQTMGDVMGFEPFDDRYWRDLLATGSPLADFILSHRLAAVVAGIAVLLLAGLATGLVRTTLRDFGFRLERTETSLRRRRGLFTRTDVSLPVRRVQAAIVGTGPVRERFGWRELKLQNLARDEGSGDHVVAPLATQEEVDRVLAELGWRPSGNGVEWRNISRAYLWIFLLMLSPVLLLLAAQAALAAFAALAITFAVVAVLLLARLLAWRRTAFALDGDRLLVRTGWWRRRLRILPVDRIQSIDIAESFLSRRFGVSNLIFGVAGGQGFSAHNIPAVRSDEARELRESLLISST